MVKSLSILFAAAISVYCITPANNSINQEECYRNEETGAWKQKIAVEHTKEVQADGTIKIGYSEPLKQGHMNEYTTFDDAGNALYYTYSFRYGRNYRDSTATYEYSSDNQKISGSTKKHAGSNGLPLSHGTTFEDISYSYGVNGKLDQEQIFRTRKHAIYPDFENTIIKSYSYDSQNRVKKKVTTSSAFGTKETRTYSYFTNNLGETVITENCDIIGENGAWSRPEINPVKKYCNPNDTIIEEYSSATNKLVRRISNSYLNSGDLLESIEYEVNPEDNKLYRSKRFIMNFDNE